MSQRTEKVQSLVRQRVASALAETLAGDNALVTVTGVDVSPDLRQATVWIGLLGSDQDQDRVWELVESSRAETQAAVAKAMTTKYVPHLEFRRDRGGDYAQHIEGIIKQL
jgi:ribosome-binding factor A